MRVLFVTLALMLFAGPAYAQIREGDTVRERVVTIDGREVALGAGGPVVVVEFWATWCKPCRHALPMLDALVADLGAEEVTVVAISIDSRLAPVERAVTGLGIDVVWDRSQALLRRFSPPAIPTTFVISPDGLVVAVGDGFDSNYESWLRRAVTAALGRDS